MSPRLLVCPRCAGPRLLDDVTALRMQHRARCPIGEGERVRQIADADQARARGVRFLRPAVYAERTLLESAGVDLGEQPLVEVVWLTPSLRRRVFTDKRGTVVDLDADVEEPATSSDDVTGSAGAA